MNCWRQTHLHLQARRRARGYYRDANAVVRSIKNKTALHGIAQNKTRVAAERQDVPKTVPIRIFEQQMPSGATVRGFVKAGSGAGATGHHLSMICIPAEDATKIEFIRIGRDAARLPHITVVLAAQDGAFCAARPDDASAGVVNAAEGRGTVCQGEVPLRGYKRCERKKGKDKSHCELFNAKRLLCFIFCVDDEIAHGKR